MINTSNDYKSHCLIKVQNTLLLNKSNNKTNIA